MGGGKSKTYQQVAAHHLFNPDDDLMMKEIIRLKAATDASLGANGVATGLITNINNYYSAEAWVRMGVAVKQLLAVREITANSIYDHINNANPTYTNSAIYYYTQQESDGTPEVPSPITAPAYRVRDHLQKTYNHVSDYTVDFIYPQSITIGEEHADNTCNDTTVFNGKYIYNAKGNDSNIPDSFDLTIITEAYEINTDEFYFIVDPIRDVATGTITMELLDATWIPTGILLEVDVPEDLRTMFIYRYAYTEAIACDTDFTIWEESQAEVFFREDLSSEEAEYSYLLIPVKHYYTVFDDRYLTAMYQKFGLGNGELKESLADPKIHTAFITYSANEFDVRFKDVIEKVYGTFGNKNYVILSSPYYIIAYAMDDSGFGVMSVNGIVDATIYTPINIIPIENFRNMSLKEKYDTLGDTFNLFVNTHYVVKAKWYQSGLFGGLMNIINKFLYYMDQFYKTTFNFTGILSSSEGRHTLVESGLMSESIFGYLEVAIGVAMISLGDFSTVSGKIGAFTSTIDVAANATQIVIGEKMESISSETNRINREEEAAAKILKDARKSSMVLMNPFDTYSSVYDTAYDLVGDFYTDAYSVPYDYDIMLRKNRGV